MSQCMRVFIFIAEQYSIVCIYHFLWVHSLVNGHGLFSLYCRYILCFCEHLCTGFCVNIGFHFISLLASFLSRCIPRSGIAGSRGNPLFNVSRSCQSRLKWTMCGDGDWLPCLLVPRFNLQPISCPSPSFL